MLYIVYNVDFNELNITVEPMFFANSMIQLPWDNTEACPCVGDVVKWAGRGTRVQIEARILQDAKLADVDRPGYSFFTRARHFFASRIMKCPSVLM